jgi:hypothetical protein
MIKTAKKTYGFIKDMISIIGPVIYAGRVCSAVKNNDDVKGTYEIYRQGIEDNVKQVRKGTFAIVLIDRKITVMGVSVQMLNRDLGELYFHDLEGKEISKQQFKVKVVGSEPVDVAIKRVLSSYIRYRYFEQVRGLCFDFRWNF